MFVGGGHRGSTQGVAIGGSTGGPEGVQRGFKRVFGRGVATETDQQTTADRLIDASYQETNAERLI